MRDKANYRAAKICAQAAFATVVRLTKRDAKRPLRHVAPLPTQCAHGVPPKRRN